MIRLDSETRIRPADLGLLVLRASFGGLMLAGHGWGKLLHFSERMGSFPDPLGLGPFVSLGLATFAEVICALALMLGLATRLAAASLIGTMTVAAFVVQAGASWHDQEFALLYLMAFIPIVLTGPGRLSLDAALSRTWTQPRSGAHVHRNSTRIDPSLPQTGVTTIDE